MPDKLIRWTFSILTAAIIFWSVATAEEREWHDTSGKFDVTAELVKVDGKYVVLRKASGKEVRIKKERLSDDDREFLDAHQKKNESHKSEVSKIARKFFESLKGDRSRTEEVMTAEAKKQSGGDNSPLATLPKPAAGSRSIRLGKVDISDDIAEIPVRVKADGANHKTKLHLRLEGNAWKVFALSAEYPDGEKSINFEAVAAAPSSQKAESIVGKEMPLEGVTLDGSPLDMGHYAGKVVLVDFWATWCGPCIAEIPNVRKNWDEYHDKGFEVIAISVDADLEKLAEFVAEEQPPWTVVADKHPANQARMGARYGVQGIPAFFLIGKDGKVVTKNCRGSRLGKELEKLLN